MTCMPLLLLVVLIELLLLLLFLLLLLMMMLMCVFDVFLLGDGSVFPGSAFAMHCLVDDFPVLALELVMSCLGGLVYY